MVNKSVKRFRIFRSLLQSILIARKDGFNLEGYEIHYPTKCSTGIVSQIVTIRGRGIKKLELIEYLNILIFLMWQLVFDKEDRQLYHIYYRNCVFLSNYTVYNSTVIEQIGNGNTNYRYLAESIFLAQHSMTTIEHQMILYSDIEILLMQLTSRMKMKG